MSTAAHAGAPFLPIDHHERDVLRREVGLDSRALMDLEHCAQRGRLDHALRQQAHLALWLLDDLGWDLEVPEGDFYLTLPGAELAAWLGHQLARTDEYLHELARVDPRREALAERRHLVAAGQRDVPPVAELVTFWRKQTDGELDEQLELRSVVTALLARLGACPEQDSNLRPTP